MMSYIKIIILLFTIIATCSNAFVSKSKSVRMVPKLTGLINDILYVDGKQVGESHVTTTTMASQPLILASH